MLDLKCLPQRRRAALCLCLLLLVVFLAACDPPDDVADPCRDQRAARGLHTYHLRDSTGHRREYLLQLPDRTAADQRIPVVFLFHGYLGTARHTLKTTRMGEFGRSHGFAVVAVQAAGDPSRWPLQGAGHERDVKLLKAVLARVKHTVCVNPDRIYAAGFSNGSMLALKLACEDRIQFAAYAGVSGPYGGDDCASGPPAPVITFHGTADQVVPFGGGTNPVAVSPGFDAQLAMWERRDGCVGGPQRTQINDDVTRIEWANCDDAAHVVGYRIAGGVHTWPGARPRPGEPAAARTADASINASALIWSFFADYSRDRGQRTPVGR